MKFSWCSIHVKNMEESLKFYQEVVGLSLNTRNPAGPGTEIAFLGEGETKVELICSEGHKDSNIGQDISIGFAVDSLDETIELVKKNGYDIVEGPVQPNPNVSFFFIKDPNGLKVQFVEFR